VSSTKISKRTRLVRPGHGIVSQPARAERAPFLVVEIITLSSATNRAIKRRGQSDSIDLLVDRQVNGRRTRRQNDIPKYFWVPNLFNLRARIVPHVPRQRASAISARIAGIDMASFRVNGNDGNKLCPYDFRDIYPVQNSFYAHSTLLRMSSGDFPLYLLREG
jgi:hypothetical protein